MEKLCRKGSRGERKEAVRSRRVHDNGDLAVGTGSKRNNSCDSRSFDSRAAHMMEQTKRGARAAALHDVRSVA